MKSQRKSNSEPRLSQSKLSLYNRADNADKPEDDENVRYRLEKHNDECDFITFNTDATFDVKLLGSAERKKEMFYNNDRDLYGYSVYEDGEVPTGCGMYLQDYITSFDQKYVDEMDDATYQEYDDCYLYLSNLSKLYYIKDRRVEEIKLNDDHEFKSQLYKFMEDGDDRYTLKRMTNTDIFRIVTRTSGHIPMHMATAIPASPYEKYETYKGLYEYYLKMKDAEPATPPPHRHSHIVDHGSWHDVLITQECDENPCDKPKYSHRM